MFSITYMKTNVNQDYTEIPLLTSRVAKVQKFDCKLSWQSFGKQSFSCITDKHEKLYKPTRIIWHYQKKCYFLFDPEIPLIKIHP